MGGRSTIEWLLIIGIATSFLWPFMQLWTVQAVPLVESETQQKAAVRGDRWNRGHGMAGRRHGGDGPFAYLVTVQ